MTSKFSLPPSASSRGTRAFLAQPTSLGVLNADEQEERKLEKKEKKLRERGEGREREEGWREREGGE